MRHQIDISYDHAHTKNWKIVALNEYRDWSKYGDNMREFGYCSNVMTALEKLKEYDAEVLSAIKEAISSF